MMMPRSPTAAPVEERESGSTQRGSRELGPLPPVQHRQRHLAAIGVEPLLIEELHALGDALVAHAAHPVLVEGPRAVARLGTCDDPVDAPQIDDAQVLPSDYLDFTRTGRLKEWPVAEKKNKKQKKVKKDGRRSRAAKRGK